MTEIWHVGIVPHAVDTVLSNGLKPKDIIWLPDQGSFRFIADPFGVAHDGQFTVLAEAYDYRFKKGEIHYFTYDHHWRLVSSGPALRTGFHLSYPVPIVQGGDIYMLPEQSRSGRLILYRATEFPRAWEPVATIMDIPAVDATPVHHDGRWWMFYALPGLDNRAMRELHVAWADDILGPWTKHPGNPVRTGFDASRPGGTAFVRDGALHLPVQDCRKGYGSAINVLRINDLSETAFSAEVVKTLSPQGVNPAFTDGLHTLAVAGPVTLIDVKRNDRSAGRHWVKLQYKLNRLTGRAKKKK